MTAPSFDTPRSFYAPRALVDIDELLAYVQRRNGTISPAWSAGPR